MARDDIRRGTPDLRLLFPTTFSEACRQTGPAIAQLAGIGRLTLTMVHVVKRGARHAPARRELDTFLADADAYSTCERIVVEADDPAVAVSEICTRDRFDLVMAPASGRLHLRRLFSQSFRARLLKHCPVPLWTAGGCLPSANFRRSIGTVACLIDFDDDPVGFLRLVSAFADRLKARVQVLAVLPPVDDGTLAEVLTSDTPLLPARAMGRIQRMFAGQEPPAIDVAVGARGRELVRMLSRCDADLLFVGPGHVARGVWPFRFSSALDGLPCPVVCVDGTSSGFSGWSFQDAQGFRLPQGLDSALGVAG